MTLLTCLLFCLFLALSTALPGWQGAYAGEDKVSKPEVKLRVSNANDARICPPTAEDDSLLRKMLPLRERKHLKLVSELEGLADRGVSQPWKDVS